MNTKQFRTAVFGEIEAWAASNQPTLPVIYENGPVPDQDKIGPIWLDVSVRWYGAQSLSLGEVVRGRYTGAISLQVFYREASGTAQVDEIVDDLQDYLSNRRIGSSIIEFGERTVPTHLNGWYKSGLFFPFSLDR